MFEELDIFVFTFGLTETWLHKPDGAALPLAPGVAGGEFDDNYEFCNMRASDVVADFLTFVDRLGGINPQAKIIVTVSPVPLIATYEIAMSSCRIATRRQRCASPRRRSSRRDRTSPTFPPMRS